MFYLVVPTGLQDVHESDQIAFDVGVRIGERITDPRLCRQIDHHVEFFSSE